MNGLNAPEVKRSAEGNPVYFICCTVSKREQTSLKYKFHVTYTVDLSDEEQMKQ